MEQQLKILAIDIGGTHVKASLLDIQGNLVSEFKKVDTPPSATPEALLGAIAELLKNFSSFDKISAGFPGFVKQGVVYTAPNLNNDAWVEYDLAKKLKTIYGKPARVVNDADMQGLGIACGKGFEMLITLGTGFGTSFLKNGHLLPHIELAHHPLTKKHTYDSYLGDKALKDKGGEKWNKRLHKVIKILKRVFNYDHLYLGGGNAANITFSLDPNITIVSNQDGIPGGARLWNHSV